jgi:ATP-dependent Clp protease, protease subunit
VIAMAGDVVEMPGNAFLMIHNPWVMAVGDEKEIARAMAMLVKIKSSLISVYEHKTGMSTNDLSAMMDEETWLIAEEAVQLGFADKIVGTAKVNNMAFYNQLTNFRKVPDAIKNLANVPAVRRPDEPSTKETNMQLTIEKVKAEHPDIAKALIDEGLAQGMQEGAKNELERVLAVQAQTMPGHEKLIAELVADGKTTGPEAAVKVLAAEKQIRLNAQASLDADGVDPVAHNNPPDGNDPPADDEDLPIEERAKAEWDKDGKLRKEFSGDFKVYLAYRKNEINVRSIGK